MKKAFTMIEMIFVIIVIGILSAIAIPRVSENHLNEAADQVISHIRYTQHLAMQDNKFDQADNTWFQERWQIAFNGEVYTIFSDQNKNNTQDLAEIATNPNNPTQRLTGDDSVDEVTRELDIGVKYDITSIAFSPNCGTGNRISFDSMGRPISGNPTGLTGPYSPSGLISGQCQITLTSNGETKVIAIEAETGYTHIL